MTACVNETVARRYPDPHPVSMTAYTSEWQQAWLFP